MSEMLDLRYISSDSASSTRKSTME